MDRPGHRIHLGHRLIGAVYGADGHHRAKSLFAHHGHVRRGPGQNRWRQGRAGALTSADHVGALGKGVGDQRLHPDGRGFINHRADRAGLAGLHLSDMTGKEPHEFVMGGALDIDALDRDAGLPRPNEATGRAFLRRKSQICIGSDKDCTDTAQFKMHALGGHLCLDRPAKGTAGKADDRKPWVADQLHRRVVVHVQNRDGRGGPAGFDHHLRQVDGSLRDPGRWLDDDGHASSNCRRNLVHRNQQGPVIGGNAQYRANRLAADPADHATRPVYRIDVQHFGRAAADIGGGQGQNFDRPGHLEFHIAHGKVAAFVCQRPGNLFRTRRNRGGDPVQDGSTVVAAGLAQVRRLGANILQRHFHSLDTRCGQFAAHEAVSFFGGHVSLLLCAR